MMARPSVGAVLEGLEADGVLDVWTREEAAAALGAGDPRTTPWYVRVLIGAGAWAAAGVLALAFGIAGLVDGRAGAAIVGAVAAVGATVLRYRARGDFLEQLTLAVSLAGEGIFVAAAGGFDDGTALVLLLVEGATFVLFPDAVHRFLSAILVVLAGVWGAAALDAAALYGALTVSVGAGAALLRLEGTRLQASPAAALQAPAAYGLLVAFFGLLLASLFVDEGLVALGPVARGALLLGALGLVAAILSERDRPLLSPAGLLGLGAVALVGVLTWQTPGLAAALGFIALGHHRRSLLTAGLAFAFLLVGGVLFYYQLEMTLLAKSGVLVATGAVLLGGRAAMRSLVR